MLGDKLNDVKTSDASSASATNEGSEPRVDVKEDSSTSQETSTEDVKPALTMADAVKQALDDRQASEGEDSKVEEGEVDKKELDSKIESDKKKEEKVGEDKEDPTKEESDKADETPVVEGKPVPYERFKEVNDKYRDIETKFKEVAPKAEHFDRIANFCLANAIAPADFQKAIELQALLSKGDGEAALKHLLPLVESLQGYVGNKLPADLQTKVDDGKMELDDARELATARAKLRFNEATKERNAKQGEETRKQEFARQCETAASTWEAQKRTSDTDYKPKANESAPDGKWELVRDKYVALLNRTDAKGNYINLINSSQDMVKLMERAYTEISTTFKSRNGYKPATGRRLSSSDSSTTSTKKTIEEAGSLKEAMELVLNNR